MSSDVKTQVVWLPDGFGGGGHAEVCRATDYAALEAECERLRKEKSARQALSIQLIDEARALRTELAAIKRREPVCEVSEETFSSDGTSDIITCKLPIGTKLYILPATLEGGDV